MWKERYLRYFNKMEVAGRGSEIGEEILNLSSGPNVKHYILSDLSRIKNRAQNIKKIKADLEMLIGNSDALVARMPSGHAYHAIKIARKLNKPYVVEIVGDVFAALWTHGSLVGKILAPINYIKYKRIINKSSHLIYVTQDYLQEKYPPNSEANTTNASNVDISFVPKEILFNKLKEIKSLDLSNEINIGLIGSYSSKYKGIDTAIKSIKILKNRGINCNLVVLGNGKNKWLKNLSVKLNIESNIIFAGSLPGGEDVFKWLDGMDLYIQPSLTEGLPRALIEAMSRGLPCVASSVGGIPELIDEEFIHRPKSEKELSEKIDYLLRNQDVMLEQAEKNYSHAKEYTAKVLNERRGLFWSKFIDEEIKKQ